MTIEIASGTPSLEKPTMLADNLFTQGTFSVTSETSDGSGANALSDGTFDYWTGSAEIYAAIVDMGTDTEADAVGIAAHTCGTDGVVLRVQTSPDNTTWTTRLTITPTDDSTIMGVWPVVSSRYWRVQVFSGGPTSIGVLKLGKRIVIPSGVSLGYVSIDHAQRIDLLSNDSMNGQFLGTRVERRSGDVSLDMGLVPRSFIEGDFAEFEIMYNEGRTFFYCGSPSNLPLDTGYCKRPANGQEIRPSHVGGDLMQLQFGAQVYVG